MLRLLAFVILVITANAAPPRDALPLDAAEWPLNFRLHLDSAAKVRLTDGLTLSLDAKGPHDIAVEHPAKGAPVLRVWSGGKLVRGPEELAAGAAAGAKDYPDAKLDLGADVTGTINDLSLYAL